MSREMSVKRAWVLLLVFGTGCAAAAARKDEKRSPEATGGGALADRDVNGNVRASPSVEAPRDGAEKPVPEAKPPAPVSADPGYARVPETNEGMGKATEVERTVTLPPAVAVATVRPELPDHPLVAVAFVRGGKLVRRPDALRALGHELGRDESAVVVAIEPLGAAAPLQVGLDDLGGVAARQGAQLLLVDVRASEGDPGRTTFVVHATTRQVLAHLGPRDAAPATFDVVAKVVRSSRSR